MSNVVFDIDFMDKVPMLVVHRCTVKDFFPLSSHIPLASRLQSGKVFDRATSHIAISTSPPRHRTLLASHADRCTGFGEKAGYISIQSQLFFRTAAKAGETNRAPVADIAHI